MTKEMYILGRAWPALLSIRLLPPILRGNLPTPMHPTLVVRRNSKTAPAALTSHKSLTEGGCGCSHSHASPTSLQSLRRCSVHDAHRVNR